MSGEPMTAERVRAIRERADASAPARCGMAVCLEEGHVIVESDSHTMTMADVDFYEHARADVLALLAALATVTAERDAERAYRVAVEAYHEGKGSTQACKVAEAALTAAGGRP